MLQSDVELRCNKSRHLLFTLPQSFSQPQRAYLSHPHLSGHLPLSPHLAISRLHHTCTYLHTPSHLHTPALYSTATAQRLCEHFSRPSTAHQTNPHSHRLTPNPRDDLRPRPRRPRKRPRHRRHGIHRSLPLCRCQRQANGGVV